MGYSSVIFAVALALIVATYSVQIYGQETQQLQTAMAHVEQVQFEELKKAGFEIMRQQMPIAFTSGNFDLNGGHGVYRIRGTRFKMTLTLDQKTVTYQGYIELINNRYHYANVIIR